MSNVIFWLTSTVVYIVQYSMQGLLPALSISLVHRINHLKCIMHRITPLPSPLGWGCLDFIRTLCESTVTKTDLLMNLSSESAAYWNSGGIPASKLLHLIQSNSHRSGAQLQRPLIMKNRFSKTSSWQTHKTVRNELYKKNKGVPSCLWNSKLSPLSFSLHSFRWLPPTYMRK